MPAHTVYDRPYVARPVRANNLVHDYNRNICCGVQMRGDNDDLPVIIYYGATWALVFDTMAQIAKMMGENIKGYVIRREHSCRWKNGKAYYRLAVEIHGLNEEFMSLQSFLLVINGYMQKICWCTVKELPLRKLLNL